jgi:ubiquinone/menaquinone biosynthesis C-methylase UbiE
MSDKGEWTTDDWVKNLKEQAEYFKEYRHNLYKKVSLKTKGQILDIGCGTGVITKDIAEYTHGRVTGIDIDHEKLHHAFKLLSRFPSVTLLQGNAVDLPFKDNTFDLVVFTVVLMYVPDKQKAVNEMARVTKKNGIVLATMEPDYASSISYPEDCTLPLFFKSMEKLGADLKMGRKLRYLFGKANLKTEIGIHTWNFDFINEEKGKKIFLKQFWLIEKTLIQHGWTEDSIQSYKQEKLQLIEDNLAFSFMPVYYAIGRKQ